jgi:hypothetical protein
MRDLATGELGYTLVSEVGDTLGNVLGNETFISTRSCFAAANLEIVEAVGFFDFDALGRGCCQMVV